MSQLTDEQIREAWERTEIWSAEGASQSLPSFARGFCYTLRIKPARLERWVVVDKNGRETLCHTRHAADIMAAGLGEQFDRIVYLVEPEK